MTEPLDHSKRPKLKSIELEDTGFPRVRKTKR